MLVIFEGVEGVGKSSVLLALSKLLLDQGIKVLTTREPGGTVYAEKIRDLILFPGAGSEEPLKSTQMMLAFASRKQHVEYVIKPSLANGEIVLCDRFIGSTYTLQKAPERMELYNALCKEVLEGLPEPLYVVLSVSYEEARKRREGRGTDGGIIEDEFSSEAAHLEVTKGLDEFLLDKPNTLKISGDDLSIDDIAQEIFDYVIKHKHEQTSEVKS